MSGAEPIEALRAAFTMIQRIRGPRAPRLAKPEAVERFEARLGITLPASYRRFILEVGHGGPGPGEPLRSLSKSHMPKAGSVRRVVTARDSAGTVVSAGTGKRRPKARKPDPARPFPLSGPWDPRPADPRGPPPARERPTSTPTTAPCS